MLTVNAGLECQKYLDHGEFGLLPNARLVALRAFAPLLLFLAPIERLARLN